MYSHLLIDLSNIFYRNYFVHKDQNVVSLEDLEIYSGGIQGTLISINKLKRQFLAEDGKVHFLLDNFSSRDSFRKSIDPDYKINRAKYSDGFYRSLDYLTLILSNHSENYYLYRVDKTEADDLVPAVLSTLNNHDKALICTEDMDFSRMLSENVHWYAKNKIYTKELYKEEFGFEPDSSAVILWKTVRGDDSDHIQAGVKGIPTKILLKLIEDFESIYDIFEKLNTIEYLSDKWKEAFKENKARLILNSQLIDFIEVSKEELEQNKFKASYSPNTLRSLYKLLNIKISEVDQRLMQSFPEVDNKKDEDFFNFGKVERK